MLGRWSGHPQYYYPCWWTYDSTAQLWYRCYWWYSSVASGRWKRFLCILLLHLSVCLSVLGLNSRLSLCVDEYLILLIWRLLIDWELLPQFWLVESSYLNVDCLRDVTSMLIGWEMLPHCWLVESCYLNVDWLRAVTSLLIG